MDARHGWRQCASRLRFRLPLFLLGFLLVDWGGLGPESNRIFAQPFQRRMAPRMMAPAMMAPGNAPVVTANFEVNAPDPQFAQRVAQLAESYRRDLAVAWLGHELPNWQQRCPIQVTFGPHAGGETSFAFISNGVRSEPVEWEMKIYGPPERILDSVLPHEVTHTIFATHFGRPLPRWADEGACTTVEHEAERTKNQQMLIDFLSEKPSRGIPFNRMFLMRDYPHDILPLYAQGYSLARFLMLHGDRRQFIKYVEAGLAAEQPGQELAAWNQATREFYGFEDLSELQVQWLGWVKQGCPNLAETDRRGIVQNQPPQTLADQPISSSLANTLSTPAPQRLAQVAAPADSSSWYHSQAQGVAGQRQPPASAYSGRTLDSGNLNRLATAQIGYLPGSIAGYDAELWRQWSEPSLTTMKTTLGPVLPHEMNAADVDLGISSGSTKRSGAVNTLWR